MSLGRQPRLGRQRVGPEQAYMAVHVIPARRAFGLLFKELAEVVTLDDGHYRSYDFHSWREVSAARARFKDPDDDYVRTVHFEIQAPRVIRLLGYDRLPRQRSSSTAATCSPATATAASIAASGSPPAS